MNDDVEDKELMELFKDAPPERKKIRKRRKDAKFESEAERTKYRTELLTERNRIKVSKKYFDKALLSNKYEIKVGLREYVEYVNQKYNEYLEKTPNDFSV